MLPLKQLRICSSPGSSISDHPSCCSGIDSADQRTLHLPLCLDCFSEGERRVRGIPNSRTGKQGAVHCPFAPVIRLVFAQLKPMLKTPLVIHVYRQEVGGSRSC